MCRSEPSPAVYSTPARFAIVYRPPVDMLPGSAALDIRVRQGLLQLLLAVFGNLSLLQAQ